MLILTKMHALPPAPEKNEPQILGASETIDVLMRRTVAGRLFAVTGLYRRALYARSTTSLVVRVPSRIADGHRRSGVASTAYQRTAALEVLCAVPTIP